MISNENLEELVERHMGFIIRTISRVTGKYVSVEHDDAFSIALSAFAEAVERFQPERGKFLSFARLVMRSRLLTYLEQERKRADVVSLDEMYESGKDLAEPASEEQEALRDEIHLFHYELSLFHLTFEDLAEASPKHSDTRERAVDIAEQSSQHPPIVSKTYQKKKLPVRDVAHHCGVTEKIVKGSKQFILATMLIFVKKFPMLLHWIRKGRCRDV